MIMLSTVEYTMILLSTVEYTIIKKSTKQLGTVCQERQSGVTAVAAATGTALKLDRRAPSQIYHALIFNYPILDLTLSDFTKSVKIQSRAAFFRLGLP